MSRSADLLAATSAHLHEAASARFMTEVGCGGPEPLVFANYLLIEEGFVATASRMHGMAIWDAPDTAAIARHADALAHLTGEQTAYFASARRDWPVGPGLSASGVTRARGLSDVALRIAGEGGYAGVVTALLAAEHLYATWCARAASSAQLQPGLVGDWVRLHTRPAFLRGVADLSTSVDRLTGSDAPADEVLTGWFDAMLAAEIEFHAAPYELD